MNRCDLRTRDDGLRVFFGILGQFFFSLAMSCFCGLHIFCEQLATFVFTFFLFFLRFFFNCYANHGLFVILYIFCAKSESTTRESIMV